MTQAPSPDVRRKFLRQMLAIRRAEEKVIEVPKVDVTPAKEK